jgi:hypothetical protein
MRRTAIVTVLGIIALCLGDSARGQTFESYQLHNFTNADASTYQALSNGDSVVITSVPALSKADAKLAPETLQKQAGGLEGRLIDPPVIQLRSGWLYVAGAKPRVGTTWVYASAEGSCLIVTVNAANTVHRIYYHRARPRRENEKVKTYNVLGNELPAAKHLSLYQYIEVTRDEQGNFVYSNPKDEVEGNPDDELARAADAERVKFELADY